MYYTNQPQPSWMLEHKIVNGLGIGKQVGWIKNIVYNTESKRHFLSHDGNVD